MVSKRKLFEFVFRNACILSRASTADFHCSGAGDPLRSHYHYSWGSNAVPVSFLHGFLSRIKTARTYVGQAHQRKTDATYVGHAHRRKTDRNYVG